MHLMASFWSSRNDVSNNNIDDRNMLDWPLSMNLQNTIQYLLYFFISNKPDVITGSIRLIACRLWMFSGQVKAKYYSYLWHRCCWKIRPTNKFLALARGPRTETSPKLSTSFLQGCSKWGNFNITMFRYYYI